MTPVAMRRTTLVAALLLLAPLSTAPSPASAVVDPEMPTGSYTMQSADGTGYLTGAPGHQEMRVYFNVGETDDNMTLDKDLKQVFFAGDGSPGVPWAYVPYGSVSLVHAYKTPGSYVPYVELTDEDGNTATIYVRAYSTPAPTTVTVLADTVAPTASISLPAPRLRHRIAGWRVIRGTATDVGSGISTVEMHLLQRRAGRWYIFDFFKRRWFRGSSSYAWTLQHLGYHHGFPGGGSWYTRPAIKGLTKGRTVVEVTATDRAGNVTRAKRVDVRITRR